MVKWWSGPNGHMLMLTSQGLSEAGNTVTVRYRRWMHDGRKVQDVQTMQGSVCEGRCGGAVKMP